MSRWCSLLAALALAACGDNLAPPTPRDCGHLAPPPTGLGLDAAREAHRRAALRQRLRYREAIEPGYVLRETSLVADQGQIDLDQVCAQELSEVGRILFAHELTPSAPFRRVQLDGSGPETTSCTSCHWRGGAGGAGGFTDNAFLRGDGDRVSTGDARNPPSLIGAGVVQAIGDEMTAELAALRAGAITRARDTGEPVEVALIAKGISFGTLHVDARGTVDARDVRGVDPDLVIRPFGWKGTAATIHEMVSEQAAQHLAQDLTPGQLTALSVYVASLELPIGKPHEAPVDRADPAGPVQPFLVDGWVRGRAVFDALGCPSCHVPSLPLARAQAAITSPVTGGTFTVDLARDAEAPRLTRDPESGVYPAYVFSDFKRHDLGDENASQHVHGGIAPRLYLTRRLWGVGDSAPYLHDGAAATVDHAIGRHGGEAAAARQAWTDLPVADRNALRVFLTSLRRAPRLGVP